MSEQPPSPTVPRPPTTRARFTDSERHALRAHHALLTSSGVLLPQSHLSTWFQTTYGHSISQSQISKILSARYAHLDSPPKLPDNCRNRAAAYPELDRVLGEWYVKARLDGAKVSGDDLREVARRFWMEGYGEEGEEMPKFSNGWLEGFKHRHGVERKRYNKDPHKPKRTGSSIRPAQPDVKAPEALRAFEVLDRWAGQKGNGNDDEKKWLKRKVRELRELAREEEKAARLAAMDAVRLQDQRLVEQRRQAAGQRQNVNGSGIDCQPPYNPTSGPRSQSQQIDPRLNDIQSHALPYPQRYNDAPQVSVGNPQPWILQHGGHNA